MKNRSTLFYSIGVFSLAFFLVFSFAGLTKGQSPASAERTITPTLIEKGQGGTVTVTVNIQVNEDLNGLALDEDPPGDWPVTLVDDGGAVFKKSEVQFLWLTASAGDTKTVVYEVAVPEGEDYGSYKFGGITTAAAPSFESEVSGDKHVTIPAVEVKRKIENYQVVNQLGGTATVTVAITPKTKLNGLGLDEDLEGFPSDWGDWKVESVDPDGGTFKPSEVQWVWTTANEGETKTVVYKVTVPEGEEKGLYPILGEVGSNDPEFVQAVKPNEKKDRGIEIIECLPVPYVVSHWDTEAGELDPDDAPTISMAEILNAIKWWANSTPVPKSCDKTVDLPTILELIDFWANETPVEQDTAASFEPTAGAKESKDNLVNLSVDASDEKLSPTGKLPVTLTLTPKVDIKGLAFDVDLPDGLKLVPVEKADSTYKQAENQYLWLTLDKGEEKKLTYNITASVETTPGEYSVEASLQSKSPCLIQNLSEQQITITKLPELNLDSALAYPNPVSKDDKVIFRANGQGILSTSLNIYSLSGDDVYTNKSDSNTVSWSLIDNEGNKVTNGIYLYQLQVEGRDSTQMSEIKKLVVVT